MNEALKKDLDRVWVLSNDVATAAASEALRDLVRKIQNEDDRREKTEAEIREEDDFKVIASALQNIGVTDESSAFAVYQQIRERDQG